MAVNIGEAVGCPLPSEPPWCRAALVTIRHPVTTLYCTVLCCTVLYCTALYCALVTIRHPSQHCLPLLGPGTPPTLRGFPGSWAARWEAGTAAAWFKGFRSHPPTAAHCAISFIRRNVDIVHYCIFWFCCPVIIQCSEPGL